jgi:arylsulfatase
VRWPGKVENQGGYCEQIGHVIDLLPTCADAADVSYPTEYKGFKINDLDGMSLISALKGKKVSERTLFWEHEANRGVRVGKWKLVSAGNRQEPYAGEWELYDLENDPAEMSELGGKYPDKKAELAKLWHKWAEDNKVYPLEGSGWFERVKKYADRAAEGGK